MKTITIEKSRDVGLYYIYFDIKENNLEAEVRTISSNSTNVNLDYDTLNKKIVGIELLAGLKYIDRSFSNKSITLAEIEEYLHISFKNDPSSIEQEIFDNKLFNKVITINTVDNSIVGMLIKKTSIEASSINTKYNLELIER